MQRENKPGAATTIGADFVGAPAEEFGRFLEAEHGRRSAAVKAAVKID